MGVDQERVVLEFLRCAEGRTQDVEAMTARMTEDIVWRVNVPLSKVVQGRDAARAEIERQNTVSTGMLEGSEVVTIASNDNVVFTERVDVVELAGKQMTFRINGIFEVRDGQIAAWREYFDTCDMVQQLGMPLGFDPNRLYQT